MSVLNFEKQYSGHLQIVSENRNLANVNTSLPSQANPAIGIV